jgi:cation diffusion facilitator CzcD-associated flavoprotein CzcO
MQTNALPSNTNNLLDAEHSQTIIVGAGPAGLAVGACLQRASLPCLILEQGEEVGTTWRRHYERLHLHTDKGHSALPFYPLPKDYPRYPSRIQVIHYLEAYAQHFQLAPRFGQHVISACYDQGSWEVRTQDTVYQASNLVVATGYNREPYLPDWDGQSSFRGTCMHSSQYKNGEAFKNQKVLVVGFGNSGGEIAIDLWEHGAQPALAVRGPVNVIPRELFGIPILTISILQRNLPPRLADALNAPILGAVVGDLARYGLRKFPGGPLTQIQRVSRIPLIDVGTIKLIKEGQVRVYPGIERFTEDGVAFTDGGQQQFDAVILATGYRPRVDAFLEGASAALDESGTPLSSGQAAPIPGLYFCGYYVSPTGMLREIALEAQHISRAIARKPTRRF